LNGTEKVGLASQQLAVGNTRGIGDAGLEGDIVSKHVTSASSAKSVLAEGRRDTDEWNVVLAEGVDVGGDSLAILGVKTALDLVGGGSGDRGARHDTPVAFVVLGANGLLHWDQGVEDIIVGDDRAVGGGKLIGASSTKSRDVVGDEALRTSGRDPTSISANGVERAGNLGRRDVAVATWRKGGESGRQGGGALPKALVVVEGIQESPAL